MQFDDRKLNSSGPETETGIFCRGESMWPLFRPGDRIRFVPCCVEELKKGDVILFIPPGQKERVVHRVLSTGPGGVRTKGDANLCRDSWGLFHETIVGRAMAVERNGRVIPVSGGVRGHLLGLLIHVLRKSDHFASYVLNPSYRVLARTGLFRALLPHSLRPKVIEFERDGAKEMCLVMGSNIVGRRRAGEERWIIRRPYRIFVDEQGLPEGEKGRSR